MYKKFSPHCCVMKRNHFTSLTLTRAWCEWCQKTFLKKFSDDCRIKFCNEQKIFFKEKIFLLNRNFLRKSFCSRRKKFLRSRKVFLLQKTFLHPGVAQLFLYNKKFLLRQVNRIHNCWHRKTITATCERSRCAAPHEKTPESAFSRYMRAQLRELGSPIRERCCARSRMWSNWSQLWTFLEKFEREPRSGSLF